MNITTKTTTLAATVLAAGLVTATVAASAESSTQAPENGAQQIVERAVAYEGDPWETTRIVPSRMPVLLPR
jgi:hypothetical protein